MKLFTTIIFLLASSLVIASETDEPPLGYTLLLDKEKIWMPRVSAHCDYKSPARFGDMLSIEMKLGRLGRSSFKLLYQAYRVPERTHLADGYIVAAAVSRSTFKAVPLPDELRKALQTLEPAN